MLSFCEWAQDADARKGKSRWEQAMRQGHTPIKIKAKNTT